MESMSQWDKSIGTGKANTTNVAHRAFSMLICARVFVLRHLLKNLPSGTDAMVARRRWVQVLPPFVEPFYSSDIFAVVLQSLRSANTEVMLKLARSMFCLMPQIVEEEIFPLKKFFAVVDQVAAEYLKESFCSFNTELDNRPALHA